MIESNFTNKIETQYLGLVEYTKAENLQHDLVKLVSQTKQPIVIGLEHPLVLTTGYRLQPNDFLHLGLPVAASTRGGLLTIHNEGQLIVYSIISLKDWGGGVKDFVRHLLLTTQATLNEIGISTSIDMDSVGLYTANGKVAFCGIQIKEGVTLHGISLNVFNDTDVFNKIEACGISELKTDKVFNYTNEYSLKDIFNIWIKHFKLNTLQ